MNSFEYGDEEVGKKDILFAVASFVIGLSVLTLPRAVTDATKSSDGWISILIGGAIALFFTWISAKLASRFPKQTFFEYTALIVTKPVAFLLTFLFAVYSVFFVSFEIRGVGNVAKQYLFDRTPVEVISLIMLLVVVYGVSGSRAALLRLNLMFLPIVLFIGFLLLFMSLGFFEITNLKPFFIAGWMDIVKGAKETLLAFLGYEIILFYIAFMNHPKDAPKAAMVGISIPFVFYFLVYIVTIGVSGVEVSMSIVYPFIEVAKEIEVPGEFFERLESLFFTIWTMTIFNTAVMALDLSILAWGSMFRNVKKMTWIFVLTPLIYIIAMTPQNLIEYFTFGEWISYMGVALAMAIPTLLLLIAQFRGVKGNG